MKEHKKLFSNRKNIDVDILMAQIKFIQRLEAEFPGNFTLRREKFFLLKEHHLINARDITKAIDMDSEFFDKNHGKRTPPELAKYTLYLFIQKKYREAILGDLEEDFNEVYREFGLRKAQLHYWVQVLRSIWPIIGGSINKIITSAVKKLITST